MIVFVTIPKAFSGHIDTIQRNAIASWLQVAPGVEVLLAGDEPGVADAAASLGVRHLEQLARNAYGTPLLDRAFELAVDYADGRAVCFVNTDILLPPSLALAADTARRRSDRFLVIGECWNARVETRLAAPPDWTALLRGARKRGADAVDYFLFSPGVFIDVPPFAIGRTAWDNWLVWKARDEGALVVDATSVVRAIHQDHDYGHVGSLAKVRVSPEADENRRLAGGGREHLYSRYDATHRLTRFGLVPNPFAVGHTGETVRRGWAKIGYRTGLRHS